MNLRSTVVALLTSATLAFPVATPAQADPDGRDILAVLAGLAALGIIAGAAQGHGGYRPPQPPPYHPPAPPPYHPPAPPPYHPPPTHSGGLPGNCAIKVQTRYGWEKVYTAQCLWRAGYTRPLPQSCLTRVRAGHGWNQVYADYCLRRNGY